jgi:tetratricopeptide (TPR) repeat protein
MESAPTKPVYFILHLPKTAGSTIEAHLEEHCQIGMVWHPEPASRWEIRHLPEMNRVRVVLGHHVGRSLEKYFRGSEIRRIVLLRDPVSLQISYYNYMNMWNLYEGLGTYSFPLHLKSFPRNFCAKTFLSCWLEIPRHVMLAMSEEQKYEALNEALSRFWFVGDYTDCDRLVAAIAADLDVPPVPWKRNTAAEWDKRVDWQPMTVDKLDVATRITILRRNPIDQVLWESWHTAGFKAATVRPRPFNRSWEGRFQAHDIGRLAFERARLFRRDWLPRIEAMRVKSIAKISPHSAWAAVKGGRELLVALDANPDSPRVWRAILTRCLQTGIAPPIPDQHVGNPNRVTDPELSLLKGDVLRRCRHVDVAKEFLRHAPSLAKTLGELRDITERAAARDPDFQKLIFEADRARDAGYWSRGENLYRQALSLYPSHFGYLVQYAHCLKEQCKFADAEIYYRVALALRAPQRDVREHLAFVASRQGYPETLNGFAAAAVEPGTSVDDPAIKQNFDFVRCLRIQPYPADHDNVLRNLRMRGSCAAFGGPTSVRCW